MTTTFFGRGRHGGKRWKFSGVCKPQSQNLLALPSQATRPTLLYPPVPSRWDRWAKKAGLAQSGACRRISGGLLSNVRPFLAFASLRCTLSIGPHPGQQSPYPISPCSHPITCFMCALFGSASRICLTLVIRSFIAGALMITTFRILQRTCYRAVSVGHAGACHEQ